MIPLIVSANDGIPRLIGGKQHDSSYVSCCYGYNGGFQESHRKIGGEFDYCKSRKIREGFIFAKLRMRSFRKIKSLRNAEISLLLTDIGKSCPSREFLASQICYLTLFAEIKFSRKFPDLQFYKYMRVYVLFN